MRKNALRCTLFVFVFALLFLGISPIFFPKNNAPESGIHHVNSKGFLSEPENTLDVVVVGDSEGYNAFVPLNLWEDHGITSYLCCIGDQALYQSYSYLEHVFREQSPKMVILETNALFWKFSVSDALNHEVQELLPFLRYHDRWKSLTPDDLTADVDHTYSLQNKGYHFNTSVDAADTGNYMAFSEEVREIPLLSSWYACRILALCQENGAKLILISTPSTVNWSYPSHNAILALSRQLEVPYVDMNLMQQEISIDWQTDTFDKGNHLNYYGASKATAFLGDYLEGTGLFRDKRTDPAFAAWNAALDGFRKDLSSNSAVDS